MTPPTHPALVLRTGDAAGTKAVAAALARVCRPGDVVLLAGDLGAGKTTFAQGFGRALGIAEAITSPTFTLVRQYPVDPGPGAAAGEAVRVLLHADVYRLDHLQEIEDLGIGELVEDGGVALVEWGDAARPVLGRAALTVQLEAGPPDDDEPEDVDGDGHRRLTVSAAEGWDTGGRWAEVESALSAWAVPA